MTILPHKRINKVAVNIERNRYMIISYWYWFGKCFFVKSKIVTGRGEK